MPAERPSRSVNKRIDAAKTYQPLASDNWRDEALTRLFTPKSVAVVGASIRDAYGLRCIRNLAALGYSGQIYPVNPKYDVIDDLQCFPSLSSIPGSVDAVAIALPADGVESILIEAARLEIPNVVVFASGLGEGVERRNTPAAARLRELARASQVNLVGPNCLGVINYSKRSALWVDPVAPEHAGNQEGVALISQSGGLALTLMNSERRLRLTHVVSCGNQLDFGVAEAVRFLVTQPGVTAVAMIIEGLPDVEGFRKAAAAARKAGVPLAVLKIGNSSESARATIAHTGTLSGSRALYTALFRQENVIEVPDIDELVSVCQLVNSRKPPKGRRVVAVADSGGACGLIADAAVEAGLQVGDLSAEACRRLRELLPAYANPGNPLDVTASLWGRRDGFRDVSGVMAEAQEGDVMVCTVSAAPKESAVISEQWAAMVDGYGDTASAVDVPVVGLVAVGALPGSSYDRIAQAGLIPISGLRSGLSAIARVANYSERQVREASRSQAAPGGRRNLTRRERAAHDLLRSVGGHFTEGEAKRLLAIYGVATPPGDSVSSVREAVSVAQDIGFPVVAKLEVRGLHHKTELGGVVTGIASASELRSAVGRLLALGDQVAHNGARAVRLERHIAGEFELLVAARRDPEFGPVLSVAAGGVYAELMADVAERLLPVATEDVSDMLDELRLGRVLTGYRGRRGLNRRNLVGLINRVALLVTGLPPVRELELNPVAFDPVEQRWYALDALLVAAAP